jgi:putative DNA primase/helicase
MGIAAAVASGGSFGHWSAPIARRVLYIDGEMDMADLKTRFATVIEAATGGDKSLIPANVQLYARHDQLESVAFPDFGGGKENDTQTITGIVRAVRPALVILDNLSTLATVDDNNAAEAWDPFLKLLQKLRGEGVAVLVVHHANKAGENYHGSSKIPIMFDALVRLQKDKCNAYSDGATFILDFTKTRMLTGDAGKAFKVTFANGQWLWDTVVDPAVMSLVSRILKGEFRLQRDAARAIGKSEGETSKMLQDAYTAGLTTREKVQAAFKAAREEAREEQAAVEHDAF